jgi:OmpA-OmpF porin, OOP family
MKRSAALAVGVMVLGLASTANAQTGWYVGVGAGAVIMQDPKTNFTPRNVRDPEFKAKMDTGFAVNLSAGYSGLFIPEFRAEGEIGYRSNGVSSISISPPGVSVAGTGHIDSADFMLNGYYDFLNSSAWTPYLGVGVGAGRVTLNDVGFAGPPTLTVSGNDWQFAYQGIAGIRYSFTPTWSASLDYRYFSTLDPKFTVNFLGTKFTQSTQYHTHNLMLGLAYHFVPPPPPPPPVAAAPPPPPAPAPAPPPRQFVVYFEFDKSDLTPEGAKVVQDAAAAYKATGSARIAVTGYTDLAGTQQYNLGLSKRRADTVRAALVRQGVPDGAIAEAWRGKQNPAVPTPDGVREPRNRRVEIML